ncbi:MAG: guanylate kinase [Alphaproteobacteria bacterium]|jgi:guanylate kinase|nr:MAG: guanylate kinase [Alphaproteobacteria bacterium]
MDKLKRRGILFVLSSPSGAGKTSIARYILDKDKNIKLSVSLTTRKKRKNEKAGIDYDFISKDVFEKKIKNNFFLEWATVFGNYYGTSREKVQKTLQDGNDVLFDIDWQGTQQLSDNKDFDLVTIFILPPSKTVLEKRLNNRAQDSKIEVIKRMSQASDEISHYMEYNYIVINNNLEDASNQVLSILKAERLKRKRLINLNEFITFLRS